MNRKVIVVLALVVLLVIVGCTYEKKEEKSDALRFKEEYEIINGKEITGTDRKYRTINIPEDNPFIYADANDILTMMDNGETFVVYFGFPTCPWCRSVLPTLVEVSQDLKLDRIYYVDVSEIRDVLEINDEGEVVTAKEGSEGYLALVEKLDKVLEKYVLTDENDEEIETGEKRIFAPNIISVVNGNARELETGVSEKQEDPYMELTEKMKKETYNKFKCSIKCVLSSRNSCSSKTAC